MSTDEHAAVLKLLHGVLRFYDNGTAGCRMCNQSVGVWLATDPPERALHFWHLPECPADDVCRILGGGWPFARDPA